MEDWKMWEKYYITYYNGSNTLTNLMRGGEGSELENKTSFKKGDTPWNKGLSGYNTSKKGQPVPINVRNKISKTLKGRHNIGRSIPILQINKSTGTIIEEFPSAAEAGRKTGISNSAILNASCGLSHTAGGYEWRKRNEYNWYKW